MQERLTFIVHEMLDTRCQVDQNVLDVTLSDMYSVPCNF